MGEKKNIGSGAPLVGGIINAFIKDPYSETGKNSSGHKVVGRGNNSKEANTDYQKKGGKK